MKITAVQECNYTLTPQQHGQLCAHLDIAATAIENNWVNKRNAESMREMYRLLSALTPVLYYREVSSQQIEIEEVAHV
jgi:hypothetical protein